MKARSKNQIVQIDDCPVCGRTVDRRESMNIKATTYYLGHRYFLKSRQCKGDFLREPDWFIKKQRKENRNGILVKE